MSPELVGYLVGAGSALAVATFYIGRATGAGAHRRRELESQLANAHEELSRLAADLEALAEKLRAARAEHDAYRLNVVDHFSGTSDLLRDLTVQYRSVYEHLTKGASILCPEGFVGLTEGLPIPEIAQVSGKSEVKADAGSRESGPPGALDGDFAGTARAQSG